jgi:wyosine [tRNA(Phe)-imidazoG37] synthetase (radical SAM superfamily)
VIELSTRNHDRDIAGLKYVYPVISRRAGGLSIGINFNPNNACNWRCVYCQVPNLQLGSAPELDFALLADELQFFLQQINSGEFYARFNVPPEQQRVKDIAISGNGEPTSLHNFDQAVSLIAEIAGQAGIFPEAKFVLISNGSLLHRPVVQDGLRLLASHNGELWFKLDSATDLGRDLINNCKQSQKKLLDHLKIASALCPTKLQTCMLHFKQAWSAVEQLAYLELLQELSTLEIRIAQIMLYSIARQSCQPEARELLAVDSTEMEAFAADIRALGYDVGVST